MEAGMVTAVRSQQKAQYAGSAVPAEGGAWWRTAGGATLSWGCHPQLGVRDEAEGAWRRGHGHEPRTPRHTSHLPPHHSCAPRP